MTSHTTPAFIAHGGGSEESRKHPALKFLEDLVKNFFDTAQHTEDDFHKYYTEDFSYLTPHAEHNDGGSKGFAVGAGKFYTDRFSVYKHVPYTIIAVDSADGYDLWAMLDCYVDVKGPAQRSDKVTDEEGRKWDERIPIFYNLEIVRETGAPHEFKIRHLQFMMDTAMVDTLEGKREKLTFSKRHGRHEHHVRKLKLQK